MHPRVPVSRCQPAPVLIPPLPVALVIAPAARRSALPIAVAAAPRRRIASFPNAVFGPPGEEEIFPGRGAVTVCLPGHRMGIAEPPAMPGIVTPAPGVIKPVDTVAMDEAGSAQ